MGWLTHPWRSGAPLILLTALLLALVGFAAAAPVARADAYSEVFTAYTNSAGTVPPCLFSSGVLEDALKEAPTYDVEYSGITQAIQAALSARAAGTCGALGRGVARGGGTVPPGLERLRAPASVTALGGGSIPLPLLIALALAGAVTLTGLLIGLGRVRGWDPPWAQSARHAIGEAEFRLGSDWEQFRDWMSGARRR